MDYFEITSAHFPASDNRGARQHIDWKSEPRKPKSEFIEIFKKVDQEVKNEKTV